MLFLFVLSLLTTTAFADRSANTRAPYFVVKGDQSTVDGMPLKASRAEVDISGVIARVRITQIYKNEGKTPLEALYVFPGSTRAAVFGMTMHVGERKIVAQIKDRDEARKLYEQAKQQGKTASLLEQQRPNVFQMNVANILPGDEIKVIMDYTELLIPEDGVYELVYPAVVGPRFTEKEDGQNNRHDKWTQTPYTRAGVRASYDWDMKVSVAGGVPIRNIASPSHKITTQNTSATTAVVNLADGSAGGDRDFVLRYELRGEAVETGLLLHEGAKEKFFLMMVQPPKAVKASQMPAREYIFIVDVSGSMRGFPLNTAKQVLGGLLDGLRSKDRFNIMTFSGGNAVLSPKSLNATPQNIARAMQVMGGLRGGGGTRLLPALRQALAMPSSDDTSRTFVVVTDGYVSVEAEAFELIRKNLNKANLFAFGIGSSVNRHLIEGMARAGMGEPFMVLGRQNADAQVARFQRYIESPALTNIKVSFRGLDAYDVEPVAIPDLFAQRPVVVFGKYRGTAGGRIVLSGTSGRGKFTQSLDVTKSEAGPKNEALRYLWARHRLTFLSDLASRSRNEAHKEEITQLGLAYNLMTKYTSFIAIDERVRNESGKSTTVKQPLPLPHGVPNTAVAHSPVTFTGSGRGASAQGHVGGVHRKYRKGGMVKRYSYKTRGRSPLSPKPQDAEEQARKDSGTQIVTHRGPVSASAISQKVTGQIKSVGRCMHGKTRTTLIKLVIGKDGRTQSVQLVPKGSNAALEACLLRVLKSLQFGANATTTVVRMLIQL